MSGITGKRDRVLVLTPDRRLLHRVTGDYARRALERGEAHLTEHDDCIVVDPAGLRELTPEEKRRLELKKQKK